MFKLQSLSRTILAVVIVAAATITPGYDAAASTTAASCYQASCTGQDPVAKGCARDARTIDSFTSGYRVNLRYSAACQAAWVQIVGVASNQYGGYILGAKTPVNGAFVLTQLVHPPSRAGSYSRMISFQYWVKACKAYNASGWEVQHCTAYH